MKNVFDLSRITGNRMLGMYLYYVSFSSSPLKTFTTRYPYNSISSPILCKMIVLHFAYCEHIAFSLVWLGFLGVVGATGNQ